jgi:MFS family permease
MTVLSAFVNPLSARAAERFGPRVPIGCGMYLMTCGLLSLALVPAGIPTWTLALLMLPVGLRGPLAMPSTTALLVNSVPAHQTGTASGVFNTSRQLGGALAVAVFGALIADQAHFLPGLRISLVLAALTTPAAATASLYLRHTPAGAPEDEDPAARSTLPRPAASPSKDNRA